MRIVKSCRPSAATDPPGDPPRSIMGEGSAKERRQLRAMDAAQIGADRIAVAVQQVRQGWSPDHRKRPILRLQPVGVANRKPIPGLEVDYHLGGNCTRRGIGAIYLTRLALT
jgi:hypothetical protein